jgi:hypothetical protein
MTERTVPSIIDEEGCEQVETTMEVMKQSGNDDTTLYSDLEEEVEEYKKSLEDMPRRNTPDSAKKILGRSDLLDYVSGEALNSRIAGDYKTRKGLVLMSSGVLVSNANKASYNYMFDSKSGAGKDFITKRVLEIWGKRTVVLHGVSEKALLYYKTVDKDKDWTWDGKILFISDISNTTFNSDTYKQFTSEGGGKYITVQDQEGKEVEVRGKPINIVTSATAYKKQEMDRRFLTSSLDESPEQTRKVMMAHASGKLKTRPVKELVNAFKFLEVVDVEVPYGKSLGDMFSHKHIVMRTMFPRILDIIRASSALYQFQREKNNKGELIATKQDFENCKWFFEENCELTESGFTILQQDQKTINAINKADLPITDGSEQTTLSEEDLKLYSDGWRFINDILNKITWVSHTNGRIHLDKLTDRGGLVEKDRRLHPRTNKQQAVYRVIVDTSQKFDFPTWEDVKEKEKELKGGDD